MSLLPLHLLGSPVLRRRSEEIGTPDDEVRRLVAGAGPWSTPTATGSS